MQNTPLILELLTILLIASVGERIITSTKEDPWLYFYYLFIQNTPFSIGVISNVTYCLFKQLPIAPPPGL